MSGEQSDVDVYQTRRFEKAMDRLDERDQLIIEDGIDEIIADPLIGVQKKGPLKHLRVHKAKVRETEYLIGYNRDEGRLTIHLLQLGPHEHYYKESERRRKADLDFMMR